MTEQLGLQQVLGNGAAVDGDERPVGPVPVGVDHLGHQLLAGAALAVDEHGQAGGSRLLGDLQRLEQLGVLAEGAFEDEAALDQALATLRAGDSSVRVGSAAAAFTNRSLCESCITSSRKRAGLPEQLLDVRPFQAGRPAQRRAQDLDPLDQPRIRDAWCWRPDRGRGSSCGGAQLLLHELVVHAAALHQLFVLALARRSRLRRARGSCRPA